MTGYEVTWRTGSEDYSSDNVMVSGTTATIITALTDNVLCKVRVRTQSDAGASPYTMIQATPAAVALVEHGTSTVSVTSGHSIENLHAGLVIDWEASATYGTDFSGFDPTRQMGYIMDAAAGQERVVLGTRY